METKMIKNERFLKEEVIIRIPKLLLPEIDFMLTFSTLSRAEFFTQLIIDRLEDLYHNPELFYSYLLEHTDFKERFRKGLDQYYGKERQKDNHQINNQEIKGYEYDETKFVLELPEALFSSIDYLGNLLGQSRESVLNEFIHIRLEFIYDCTELMLDFFDTDIPFFKRLREGLDRYDEKYPRRETKISF